jgi:hypothetical protein
VAASLAGEVTLIGVECSRSVSERVKAAGQSDGLHFRAGGCLTGKGQRRQGVLDVQNGNARCVPSDGGAPCFEGRLDLAGIPEDAPR